MASTEQISHLEKLREDARDEIKRRIEQRDKYSIQLTVAMAAIVGVSLTDPSRLRVLLVAPLVSIYFTVLILYSYKIHHVLATYMRVELEPELARLCDTSVNSEWETYYAKNQVRGIRRRFFVSALWVVLVLGVSPVLYSEWGDPRFWWSAVMASVVYLIACILVTIWSGTSEPEQSDGRPETEHGDVSIK